MAKKGKISFYISSSDMQVQTNTQAYGPVDLKEDTQYRVTSKLSIQDKKIYSPMEGEIVVSNTSDPDLVNLILKPFINYAEFLGIPKVKYFIYRGIKKSSYFENTGEIKESKENKVLEALNKGVINDGELSPLIRRNKFKDSFEIISNNTDTNTKIDSFFTKEDYNQIHINKGAAIGLGSTEFGFEIMLEENGFNPTIEEARTLENIIDISIISTEANKEIKRLEILNYIDPAAYFGLFFRQNFKIENPKDGNVVRRFRDGYNLFLSKLNTGTSVYIDIRNKYGLPPHINVSGKSFSQIKISNTGNSPTLSTDYKSFKKGTTTINVWPIHILKEGFTGRKGSKYDYFRIKIAIPNKNNNELFHLQTNHLGASWVNKKTYEHKQRYEKLVDNDTNWKKEIELRTYVANNTNAVSSYIRLEYSDYSDDKVIQDQILNYKRHELSIEKITHQLTPTLIELGKTNDLTRNKTAINNIYKNTLSGLGNTIFSETKGIGCELTQGKAIDSIGEVCFSYRTANSIKAKGINLNKDRIPNKGERSNQFNRNIYREAFFYNRAQKQYTGKKAKREPNDYLEWINLYNDHKKNKSITSVHKIQFSDAGNTKNGLEIRVNDPILLTGLTGNSPAECFLSIAYTTAQKQIIETKIKDTFLANKFVFFISYTNTLIKDSGRQLFKQTFKLLGLKENGGNIELQEENLEIPFYSIDGSNFTTSEYATLFKNEIGEENTPTDRVMTNEVIPNFITGNPFDAALLTDIQNTLTQISDNGSRDRILYNEIRDYLYDGDLDNLTFEIAFRLPFYIEDITKTPYTKVTVNSAVVDNNPFINFFEKDNTQEWFKLANELRSKQQSPVLEELFRSGLTKTTANKKTYEKEFYSIASTKQEAYFATINLPINAATTFNWENPKSYFNRIGKKPHIPYSKGKASAKSNIYNLSHLKSAGVITLAQETKLNAIALANFGYEEISDGTFTINGASKKINGKYVIKEKNESTFKIYDFSWSSTKNNSGITFGFGYDIGGRSNYNSLLNYINETSANVTGLKKTVLQNALGKHKILAMKEFYPFKKEVWDTISLDYNITIGKTLPLLQGDDSQSTQKYLKRIIDYVIKNRLYMKVYDNSENQFYKDDSLKVLNVAELCVYSTFVWNRGDGRANLGSRATTNVNHAKRLIQAINTHDIRWLRYFIERSKIFHTPKVLLFLNLEGIIKHFRS